MNDLDDDDNQTASVTQQRRCLSPDDVANGLLVVVHSIKANKDPADIMGQSVKITAVCLPFVVGLMACNGRPITLDIRYINLMKVTQEYYDAQKPPQ